MDGLRNQGYEQLGQLLSKSECVELRSLYDDSSHFRSRIDMQRYRFGRGEYQYFANPLPELVARHRDGYASLGGS